MGPITIAITSDSDDCRRIIGACLDPITIAITSNINDCRRRRCRTRFNFRMGSNTVYSSTECTDSSLMC